MPLQLHRRLCRLRRRLRRRHASVATMASTSTSHHGLSGGRARDTWPLLRRNELVLDAERDFALEAAAERGGDDTYVVLSSEGEGAIDEAA